MRLFIHLELLLLGGILACIVITSVWAQEHAFDVPSFTSLQPRELPLPVKTPVPVSLVLTNPSRYSVHLEQGSKIGIDGVNCDYKLGRLRLSDIDIRDIKFNGVPFQLKIGAELLNISKDHGEKSFHARILGWTGVEGFWGTAKVSGKTDVSVGSIKILDGFGFKNQKIKNEWTTCAGVMAHATFGPLNQPRCEISVNCAWDLESSTFTGSASVSIPILIEKQRRKQRP